MFQTTNQIVRLDSRRVPFGVHRWLPSGEGSQVSPVRSLSLPCFTCGKLCFFHSEKKNFQMATFSWAKSLCHSHLDETCDDQKADS